MILVFTLTDGATKVKKFHMKNSFCVVVFVTFLFTVYDLNIETSFLNEYMTRKAFKKIHNIKNKHLEIRMTFFAVVIFPFLSTTWHLQ